MNDTFICRLCVEHFPHMTSFEHGRRMMQYDLESEIVPQPRPHGDKISLQKHLQDNVQSSKMPQQVTLKGV